MDAQGDRSADGQGEEEKWKVSKTKRKRREGGRGEREMRQGHVRVFVWFLCVWEGEYARVVPERPKHVVHRGLFLCVGFFANGHFHVDCLGASPGKA